MVDLSPTVLAKSDQLNADDLKATGPITVRITRVTGTNDKEQPIAIYYEGDNGKPYKPGKSMRRVLIEFWGSEGEQYVGRSMTLYRDKNVEFGGIKVGGIRISHMSDIGNRKAEMALATTRGAKRRYEVEPLRLEQSRGNGGGRGNGNGNGKAKRTPEENVEAYIAAIGGIATLDELRDYQADERRIAWLDGLKADHPELFERVTAANSKRFGELSVDEGDGGDGEPAAASGDDDDFFPGATS